MLKYIFSFLILSSGFIVLAQFPNGLPQGIPQGGGQSTAEPVTMKDVRALRRLEPKDWSINYLKISYDLIPTGRLSLNNNRKGQEIQASISFYKYFFMLEGGFQNFDRIRNSYSYNSSGRFFRLGPEVNLLKVNDQGGAFTFGLRYAQSHFSDKINFSKDSGFGSNDFNFKNDNAKLVWMELTTGLNLPMSGNFQMGYTIRLKVFRKVSDLDTLRPFDVAGFGRYQSRTGIGFSYYVGWAIPFKKMEEAPTPSE